MQNALIECGFNEKAEEINTNCCLKAVGSFYS